MCASRISVVTGSSRGVGRDVALSLLQSGDTVIGCSRGEPELQHDSYRHFRIDVADDASVKKMFAHIASLHGRVDLLINNAGVSMSRPALFTSSADFEAILRANLVGTFMVSREAIRLMKRARFGRIINFSSINVPLASAGGTAYNAAKAGIENLALTLSRECAGDDITINCIGLSLVSGSGMVQELSANALAEKQTALIKPALIDVSDVMHAIEFFAAPTARNITGQVIYFGGLK